MTFFQPIRAAALAAVMALALVSIAPQTAQARERNQDLSAEDVATLERVSAYLNDIRTMRGRFIQASGNQVASGQFWLRKPGRMRFTYDPPAQIELVADGTVVAVIDKELETVNTYPLSATPLKIVLARRINLAEDVDITGVRRQEGLLLVTATEDEGIATGQITLVFQQEPELALRQWIIVDAQGVETSIVLQDTEQGMRLPRSMFRIEEQDGWDD